jgi:hypothetical protein
MARTPSPVGLCTFPCTPEEREGINKEEEEEEEEE